MTDKKFLTSVVSVEKAILLIRDERVILDTDLARLQGVTTRRLNEQVKRNRDHFPVDFMFQLSAEEKAKVVANCDHLSNLKFSKSLPYAFTEHDAIMAASVLSTPRAIEASIFVVRAFVKLREILATPKQLARKLLKLEKRLGEHEGQIQVIFEAINPDLWTKAESQ